jgi:hypothetical protein
VGINASAFGTQYKLGTTQVSIVVFYRQSLPDNDTWVVFKYLCARISFGDIGSLGKVHVDFNIARHIGALKRCQKGQLAVYKPNGNRGQQWMLNGRVNGIHVKGDVLNSVKFAESKWAVSVVDDKHKLFDRSIRKPLKELIEKVAVDEDPIAPRRHRIMKSRTVGVSVVHHPFTVVGKRLSRYHCYYIRVPW